MNMKQLEKKIEKKISKYPKGIGNPKNLSIERSEKTADNPHSLSELEKDTMKNKKEYWENYKIVKAQILKEEREKC